MPKPLRQQQPSSSVARLLDLGSAARAVAASADAVSIPHATAPVPEPPRRSRALAAPVNIKRELVLTRPTDDILSELVEVCRRATGTKLTASHVARALLRSVAHSVDHIAHEVRRLGPLRLPANARDHQVEREQFEAAIAESFLAGIRASLGRSRD